ncbi:sugar phosphate isomerase/epimerase family protein [Rhizobium sp. 9140]|uniref:sugar phosphate isomerase/epimerase family protein n=1 Tax=Rhizobium sp. 9140 TaxID=1761900 RepID=UPI000794FD87|nr:sugar phosphate isomerase/epimerase [Rhizobium sp. 9140]CZT37033.1 Sugar phosphate isomerase/epimerase [Rhizobium sp. 9140]
MQLGIFAKTFAGTDPAPVLQAARAAGYETVQFNLACAGLPSLPDEIEDMAALVARIDAARLASGVGLAALSGTYNMAHPDPDVRARGRQALGCVIDIAGALRIPLVTLCTGSRHPSDQWAQHPDNATPEAWADMAKEIAAALARADAAGIMLGIEPEQANVVTSAEDARRLIAEMQSDRLRIVLDPANLFEKADANEAREIVARAVDIAAGFTAMAHAKDRHADGRFAAPGHGVVDFADFIARLRASGFDDTVVTHGLGPEEAPHVARFLAPLIAVPA